MGSEIVREYLVLMRRAFDGNAHSLMRNLAALQDGDWTWRPPDGERAPLDIALHCAAGKQVYENFAFGDGTFTWDRALEVMARTRAPDAALLWLSEAHTRLAESAARLTDEDLAARRPVHFGRELPFRDIIAMLVEHDLYHAGEVNHLRALRQRDDRF